MSFRLRFLINWILAYFRKPIDFNKENRADYRIWITEGELKIVDQARYSYLLTLERFETIFRSNLRKVIKKYQISGVMGAQIYKIKRPLRRFQRFEIVTQPLSWDEKWFYFEQKMFSKGKLVCTGVISVIFLGEGKKYTPQEMLALAGYPTESRPLSQAVQNFIAAEKTLDEVV